MSGLIVTGVSKVFPRTRRVPAVSALDGIDLHVDPGELVCIVGSSGCGKSTLLNIAGGLDEATSGEVRVGGDLVVGPGPDRGMVFQAYSLFPWKSVAENVAFGLRCARWEPSRIKERVAELLGTMGLSAWADHKPSQLSGGMRQRVAIARAMAPEPDVLLLDEPFGALDPGMRADMHGLMKSLWRQHRFTVFMVTHDIEEGFSLGSRMLVFDRVRVDPQAPQRYGAQITYDLPLRTD